MSTLLPPTLADDELHLWRVPWSGGAGEARFAALLARYTAPHRPPILRGEHGKPHFAAPFDTLGFSWSHSGDVALLAVGRGPGGFELGVDVEVVRPRARALELARRFFSPAEADALALAAEGDRVSTFLAFWTAKEAVLKAHGGGLSYGLHRVAFALAGEELRPDHFEGDAGPASAWSVSVPVLGDGVQAAVAWRGAPRAVRVFTTGL